jgi:tetratricopeptide (TPR) repeat protein
MTSPATKANTLVNELNRAIRSAHTYVPQNDLTFRRYAAEAQKLLKVNAVEGHNVLSVLYSLAGDAEKAIEHIDIALRITNAPIFWCNKAAILSNLGFFSKAQEAFEKGASPETGFFGERLKFGVCVGAFHTILKFEAIARRMQLDVDAVQIGLVRRIVSLMDAYSITDADVGKMLDVAGKILRRERLFFVGEDPDVAIWDQDALEKHIAINFLLPVTSRRALVLDRELGQELFSEIANLPFQVMLHFDSGLPQNEHFAEQSASTI